MLCNLIDQMEILDSLSIKQVFYKIKINMGIYGVIFGEFSSHKQNGMLCKLVSHTDPHQKDTDIIQDLVQS